MKKLIYLFLLLLLIPIAATAKDGSYKGANGVSNGIVRCELKNKIRYVPIQICEQLKEQEK